MNIEKCCRSLEEVQQLVRALTAAGPSNADVPLKIDQMITDLLAELFLVKGGSIIAADECDEFNGYWELATLESEMRDQAQAYARAGEPSPAMALQLFAERIRSNHFHNEKKVPETSPLTDPERDTWRKQLAALSLVIADRSQKYKRGNRLNASQIAAVAREVVEDIPEANLRGVSKDHLRENISAGLRLLQGT